MEQEPSEATALREGMNEERMLRAMRYPLAALVESLEREGVARVRGGAGGWLALVLSDLVRELRAPLVVVTPDHRQARAMHAAFRTWGHDGRETRRALLLPPPDVSPYAGASPDRALAMQRVEVARAAGALRAGDVLVAPAIAWARRVVPFAQSSALSRTFAVEEEVDLEDLRRVLVDGGYQPVGMVEDPGTFSIRGGLIDIYSPAWDRPVRMDLYGDLIESLREFDPRDQRSAESLESIHFGPVREELLTEENLLTARERLTALGGALRIPSNRIRAILEDLQQGNRFFGIESLLPALHTELEPLHARLPAETCVVYVEPEQAQAEVLQWHEGRQREHGRVLEEGEPHFPPDAFMLTGADLDAAFRAGGRRIEATRLDVSGGEPAAAEPAAGEAAAKSASGEATANGLAASEAATPPAGVLDFPALTNDDLLRTLKRHEGEGGGLAAVLDMVATWREGFPRIVFVCGGRGAATRLVGMLEQLGHSAVLREGSVDPSQRVRGACEVFEVFVGELDAGFRNPARGLAVIADREVFGRRVRRGGSEALQEATAIRSFRELVPQDLVVHVDFGVGRYGGLVRMDAGGYENDFLAIDYADGDRLYLPVYRLDRVQKYVGSGTFTRLDRLGGSTWEKTRARVKRQLADVAEELLRVQAERASRVGRAFSGPDAAYREFEAAFPYEETPHQAQAIEEVMADMSRARPMDRLICGDVGFGKTEVAIRAAYRAALDGTQTAVLVPTTVLAEQHLKTFRARLADTPVRVEALSRFRSSAETRRILAECADGKVDVLIGTHRLLSKDVDFRELGLLVVDEEQRFGVTHKERLKQMRAEVDVLTMTATPIPRTLEMSLLGIRDLSVITTPPPGRMAVRTHLARYSENVIREAILAEVERGGQVFFVHNRVETIHNVATELQRMVPEARYAVGHAQMSDGDLEKVMMRFLNREAQVLVSTTIIESGIDIASANTILINRADSFGLAQLYQLRGRVGRGSDRGHCLLLVPEPRRLSEEARRRLEVLQQHTELGSGLHIAQHDLDIRGAGSLLGRDQSGHIEAVGFELFSELLQEAVAELQGQPLDRDPEPEVKMPVAAYISEDYVQDVGQRLAFYKRFSTAQREEELFDVFAELEDRYGPADEPVRALRDIVVLKIALRQMRVTRVEAGPKSVLFDVPEDTRLKPEQVMALIQRSGGTWEFRPDMKIIRHLKGSESTSIVASALEATRALARCR